MRPSLEILYCSGLNAGALLFSVEIKEWTCSMNKQRLDLALMYFVQNNIERKKV